MSARKRLGEERLYYNPPALRRINQQQQQQQELNSKSPISSSTPASVLGRRKSETGSDEKTNLDRFVEHTIPFVPAQHFPRRVECLAAVPLVLNGSDAVVQYYVPYLSGIQLYVDPSKPIMEQRRPGEESDGNSPRETSSDGDSECGTDRVADNAQGSWNHQNTTVRGHNQYAEETMLSWDHQFMMVISVFPLVYVFLSTLQGKFHFVENPWLIRCQSSPLNFLI